MVPLASGAIVTLLLADISNWADRNKRLARSSLLLMPSYTGFRSTRNLFKYPLVILYNISASNLLAEGLPKNLAMRSLLVKMDLAKMASAMAV